MTGRHTRQSTSERASTSAADTVGLDQAAQSEQCLTDVLGQLTGKMLCEILVKESALITQSNYGMIGFAVQCTQASKVQV